MTMAFEMPDQKPVYRPSLKSIVLTVSLGVLGWAVVISWWV